MKHKIIFLFILLSSFAMAQDLSSKVFVHLFEWKWSDVAKECETYLGPNGVDAVQISPPQEHLNNSSWWARYQTVSYKLESRSGSEEEFQDMVSRCQSAGVKVYVDAVINHMAGNDGRGWAGTPYKKFEYEDYGRNDFHVSCSITDYHDRWQVQNCDLVGLADLKSESSYVQEKIADYFERLLDYGVSGFRIDAAKHIPAQDIQSILGRLNRRLGPRSEKPFIYQEVIDLGGEPIKASEYFQNGPVTEFKYGAELYRLFFSETIAWLKDFSPRNFGLLPSDQAIVFLDNHDNQRGHGGQGNVLTHKHPRLYALAHVLMLGMPYGYAQVMSSYDFQDPNAGPPKSLVHQNRSVNCFKEWKCEHRWELIRKMIHFRKQMKSEPTMNWWSDGRNRLSFNRGNRGFVFVNKDREYLQKSFWTGLAQGRYCNLIKGGLVGGQCLGGIIDIDTNGMAQLKIDGEDAVVLSVEERL